MLRAEKEAGKAWLFFEFVAVLADNIKHRCGKHQHQN